jgi:integrase
MALLGGHRQGPSWSQRPHSGVVTAAPTAAGEPWKLHDYKNWCRRVWHPAVRKAGLGKESEEGRGSGKAKAGRESSSVGSSGIPPYDLRHAYASLQIRAGRSIPELAEQMGHSPQMTLKTTRM